MSLGRVLWHLKRHAEQDMARHLDRCRANCVARADRGGRSPSPEAYACSDPAESRRVLGRTWLERRRHHRSPGGQRTDGGTGTQAVRHGGTRRRVEPSAAQGPGPPKLDGRQEAHLIALACSEPPSGHARWTLRLLADKM